MRKVEAKLKTNSKTQDNSAGGKKRKKQKLPKEQQEGEKEKKKSNDSSPYVSLCDRNDLGVWKESLSWKQIFMLLTAW